MIIFFQELILQLFLWLLKLIDGIMSIFSSIAGIVKIDYRGEEVNLLEFIIGDSTVGTIFWCVFLLGMGLCCIFAISAVIKPRGFDDCRKVFLVYSRHARHARGGGIGNFDFRFAVEIGSGNI